MSGEQRAVQELGVRREENETLAWWRGALHALPAGGYIGRELRAGRGVGGRVREIPHRDVSGGKLQTVRDRGDDLPGAREIAAGRTRQTDQVICDRTEERKPHSTADG